MMIDFQKFSKLKLKYFIKLYRLTPLVRIIISKNNFRNALIEYHSRKYK